MRFTSSFRRAGGLLAATTLGMSTAVLSLTGVAQAAPTALTAETPLTVPAGKCAVQFVVTGGSGGNAGSFTGGAGTQIAFSEPVLPGDEFTVSAVTYPGGAGGAGGGSGGDGIVLLIDGHMTAVAAGGGGAGTLANGGAEDEFGGDAPDDPELIDNIYTTGGGPGRLDGPGDGGVSGSDVPGGSNGESGFGTVGGAGGPGAGGGGGGLHGGGGGASDGTGGAGGGGGFSQLPTDGDVSSATGSASITYEYLDCDGTEMPLAPADLIAIEGDGELIVDFFPTWHEGDGVNPDTWEYKVGAGSWAPVDPEVTDEGSLAFVVDGLTNGTAYTVHVRGVSEDGINGASASVTETPYKPIGAPGNIQVSTSTSAVTFTWDAPTAAGTYALDGYDAVLSVSYGQSGGPVFVCETGPAERSCEAPAAPGLNYSVSVYAVDSAGNDGNWSDLVPVGEVAPPAEVPASDGELQAPPGAANGVVTGEKITITGTGYAPNTMVTILIYSEPQVLTAVMTDGTGSFTVEVTVPAGLPVGQHTLVAAGVDPTGAMRYMTLPVTVTEDGPTLAYTGADIALPAFGGLAALAIGGGLMFVARRREVSQP